MALRGLATGRARAGARLEAMLPPVAAAVLLLLLLAHLGLIAAGQWEGDEWLNFFLFRTEGTGFLVHRILFWSPRPVSEVLVFLYACVVDAAQRPLVTPVLGLLWALLTASALTLAPALGPKRDALGDPAGDQRVQEVAESTARFARVLTALAVLAFFLLGHQVAEMFYWPMGAAAYMTAIAALTCLVMLVLRGRHLSRSGAILAALAMIVAAGSAEIGAMAAGAAAILLAAAQWRRPARAALLLLPLGAALLVLGFILNGRAADGAALGSETSTIHALLPSLRAAATQFAHETLSLDAYPDGLAGLASGIAVKIALFLGLRALCQVGLAGSSTPPAHLCCLVAALLAASYLSIAAALWQFGLVCCQRHDSFRQCLDVLVILLLAALSTRTPNSALARSTMPGGSHARSRPGMRPLAAGSAWLLLAVALSLLHRGPLMHRLPALWADYLKMPEMLASRGHTWSSGLAPGTDMVFHEPPQGFVVGETDWPTGVFSLDQNPPWFMKGLLLYFAKQRLLAQTDHD